MNNQSLTANSSLPQTLHNQLTYLVKTERRIMHEVLRCIYQIDQTRSYADLGYGSLFDYLVKAQGYSETAALNRINGMRLLKEVPEVATSLQAGSLNLSQLHKVKVAINQEQKSTGIKVPITKKKQILEKIENCTLQETEKVLSEELNYMPTPKEKITERNEDVYLTIKLSKSQFNKLKKVQSLLSHVNIDNNYASLLETMSDFVINKKLGKKETNKETVSCGHTTSLTKDSKVGSHKSGRQFIPVATKKVIHQNAGHSCEFVSPITGKRCSSTFQLQVDHKVPIAKGGRSHSENLRLLCRTHNLSEARRWGLRPKSFADTGFLNPRGDLLNSPPILR